MKSIKWISVIAAILLLAGLFILNSGGDKSATIKDLAKMPDKSIDKEGILLPVESSDEINSISDDSKHNSSSNKVNEGSIDTVHKLESSGNIESLGMPSDSTMIDGIGYKPNVDIIKLGSPGSPEALDQSKNKGMLDDIGYITDVDSINKLGSPGSPDELMDMEGPQ